LTQKSSFGFMLITAFSASKHNGKHHKARSRLRFDTEA